MAWPGDLQVEQSIEIKKNIIISAWGRFFPE
jgi:hypothetical protein